MAAGPDAARVAGLERLVAGGEGQQLEFKKEAAHPDKIVRGPIAFANTRGGLLLGVSDHGAESLKASFEMREIVRRSKYKNGTYIRLGEAESKLFAYLDCHAGITLAAFRQLVPIGRREASQKLVALVPANLLRITPTGAGDLYTRAPHS